jgi:tetratricopeptide (TPR) repeat protein
VAERTLNGLGATAFVGLLVCVVPEPLLAPLGVAAIAAALASSRLRIRAPRIGLSLAPGVVFVLLAALRDLAVPVLWWRDMLGWLLGLSMAACDQPNWRCICPFLALGGAAFCALGIVPSAAPAVVLAAIGALEWPQLRGGGRLALVLALTLLAGLALGHVGHASGLDLEWLLRDLDGWWRRQVAGLEVLRTHPYWGVGAEGVSRGDAPPAPLVAFLAQHGWVGYGLLGLTAYRFGLFERGAGVWLAGLFLVLAPATWSADRLRVSPVLGLLLGEVIAGAGTEALPRGLGPEGALLRGVRLAVAGCVLLGGLAQGAADVMVALGDACTLRLEWPWASTLYAAAGAIAPQPADALQRLSDLHLRWGRYRADAGLSEAAAPLLDTLGLGLEDAWSLYRLGEIGSLSRVGARRPVPLLRAAVERAPDQPLYRVALGHRLLADARVEEAAWEFHQAIALDRSLLDRLFRDLRRVSTNGSLLRQILPPGDLKSHVELARLFEQTGLAPAAIREYETLLAAGDAPAWVHREFGALLGRSGRIELALDQLHELLRWSSLGPRQRLEVLRLLGVLEPSPDVRLRRLSQAVDLLGADELGTANLARLIEPLAGDRPAQARLIQQAVQRLGPLEKLRPELAARERAELQALAASLGSPTKP